MPCRCDYEPVHNNKTYQDEHVKACKAQSLVHKLALLLEEADVTIPAEMKKRVKEARADLLAHKREEHKADVDKVSREIQRAESDIRTIQKLGGEPKQKVLDQLQTLNETKVKLLQVTDTDLLGIAEY